MIEIITADELKAKLDKKKQINLIDVREDWEHKSCCIPGSSLLPVAEFDIGKINTEKHTIIYCKSGKRSLDLLQKLQDGHPGLKISGLQGGIDAWKIAGYGVTSSSASSMISLERQTFIVIGFVSLLGSFLIKNLHLNFILIPAFLGIGLIFAGITGSCTLTKLISKLPWNRR